MRIMALNNRLPTGFSQKLIDFQINLKPHKTFLNSKTLLDRYNCIHFKRDNCKQLCQYQ